MSQVGGVMATDFNPFENMPWMVDTVNVPVPVVDPSDLKIVWEQHKVQQLHPGEQSAMSSVHHLKEYSPDANPFAVWYRLSMLGLLSMFSEKAGTPVFKVLANLPMNGTPTSSIEGLLRLIQKEYGTRQSAS
jgi:hypothetical protein